MMLGQLRVCFFHIIFLPNISAHALLHHPYDLSPVPHTYSHITCSPKLYKFTSISIVISDFIDYPILPYLSPPFSSAHSHSWVSQLSLIKKMTLVRRPYGYSKMEKEDPEEAIHRRAQFLIYKVMEKADSRRKASFLRLRICRLRVKIGRRLKRFRKSMMLSVTAAKVGVYRQVLSQLKAWKRLLGGGETVVSLPHLFT